FRVSVLEVHLILKCAVFTATKPSLSRFLFDSESASHTPKLEASTLGLASLNFLILALSRHDNFSEAPIQY
ncbi:hypothetical protein ACJX0J_035279, partial [Zea mays]